MDREKCFELYRSVLDVSCNEFVIYDSVIPVELNRLNLSINPSAPDRLSRTYSSRSELRKRLDKMG